MEQVFSTDDPAIVAAFRAAEATRQETARRIIDDAEALGKNRGVQFRAGVWNLPDRIEGLFVDDPADPPEGWVYVKGRDRLEPRRGAAGEVARQWLADHQPFDVRHAMIAHGLPRNARSSAELSGAYRLIPPVVFEHEGVLWAHYRGHLGGMEGECTWTPRKLSEYYAAREAWEAAQSQVKAA